MASCTRWGLPRLRLLLMTTYTCSLSERQQLNKPCCSLFTHSFTHSASALQQLCLFVGLMAGLLGCWRDCTVSHMRFRRNDGAHKV